jgi:hypothetical protein
VNFTLPPPRISNFRGFGAFGLFLASTLALLSPGAIAQSSVAGELFSFRGGNVNDGFTVVGPPHKGFFGSMPTTFSYDSKSSWAEVALPVVAYHFKPWLSADISVPYYLHLDAAQTTREGISKLDGHDFEFGDMIFAGHYTRRLALADCTLTGAASTPTGDNSLGLSANRMTGNVTGHLERQVGYLAAETDLGFGDSSELVRESTRKNYTSLGKLGFVQIGSSLRLPRAMKVEAHAYEQLPMGTQTVFTTIQREAGGSTILHNSSAADDYGVTTRFDLPITQKLGLTANYDHSVPLQDTTVSVSLTLIVYKPIERY